MQGANEPVKDKQIKAVLFDMDGVLIDAKEWHYEALNKTLELFGHKIRRSDHLETFDGLTFFPAPNHGFWRSGERTYRDEIVVYPSEGVEQGVAIVGRDGA